ncbi:MAG: hypothetical protein GY807_17525 [Gammaproteobacteria bacterium]|nr:hypothetical protein [Gammaproteobacteria bacterium]
MKCHQDASTEISVHSALDCKDCHTKIEGFPHPIEAGPYQIDGLLCQRCHGNIAKSAGSSAHADIVSCLDCHGGAHQILAKTERDAWVSPHRQIETCGQCHDVTPGLIEGYVGGVHGNALLKSGLISAPSCSDCHGSHDVLATSQAGSRINPTNIPRTCGECHVYLLDDWTTGSVHGRRWQQGIEGPTCTACHRSHGVIPPTSKSARLKCPQTCGGCHQGRYISYRDSFHGQATDLGFKSAAVCSDCHTPHLNLPASDVQSSVHPDQLRQTCGQCHRDVPSGFLDLSTHLDPTDPNQNFSVYLVWLFMTTLLILVFGSFAMHDLLWLQRSLIGVMRGEYKGTGLRAKSSVYIKRFSRREVGIHIAVIGSFLLLAVTGLVLKFHFTSWARVVTSVLGGLESTRLLHRLGALITFGYAFLHLLDLIKRVIRDKDFSILQGWRSMVPGVRDWRDLTAHLHYFLYQGPRPAFDRWTYWEKFDYFAVFWGVMIIGVSGLLLWFPVFFTEFLPGWVVNAAHLIHSDEALLAVGFVLVFHLFHSHLRPENFPLDPVIFTGSVPLERFKMERPAEYRRLVSSRALERLRVCAPTKSRLIFAYLFGLVGMIIGVMLIAGILWGFLAY